MFVNGGRTSHRMDANDISYQEDSPLPPPPPSLSSEKELQLLTSQKLFELVCQSEYEQDHTDEVDGSVGWLAVPKTCTHHFTKLTGQK